MVEVPHEAIQRLDERLQAGALLPYEPVAVDLALALARVLASLSVARRVEHTADVCIVLHAVTVVLRPAAHVCVVLAGVFGEAFHGGPCGRQETSAQHDERHGCYYGGDLHGERGTVDLFPLGTLLKSVSVILGFEDARARSGRGNV